ncbi:MAG TPA: ATP synthase subunit I [Geobacteraceae bacterium]|nr:ATP synthase subunit I [Geobacteraceae bacterium]
MIPVKITESNIFTIIAAGNWILLAVMVAGGLAFGSARLAAGILAGGLIAVANCYWLYFILQRAMRLPAKKAVRFAQVRYVLRLVIIAVIVSILIIYSKIDVFGLLLGLSVLVLTILGITVYLLTHKGG